MKQMELSGSTQRGFRYREITDLNGNIVSVQASSGSRGILWFGCRDSKLCFKERPEEDVNLRQLTGCRDFVITDRAYASAEMVRQIASYLQRYIRYGSYLKPFHQVDANGETLCMVPQPEGTLKIFMEGDLRSLVYVGYPWRKLSPVEAETLTLDVSLVIDQKIAQSVVKALYSHIRR